MKKILIIIFIISLAMPAIAQDTLRLGDAIEIALANNYSVRLVRKQREIADNNVHVGNAGFLPTITASAGGSYSVNDIRMDLVMQQSINKNNAETTTYNGAVQLNWTIFDGMGMFISLDRLELLRQKSDIELQLAMEEMLRSLIAAYYNAATARRNMKVAADNLGLSRQRYQRAKDRAEYGAAVRVQLLRAEVDLNADSSAYMQSELEYKNIIRQLNFVMGRSHDEKFIPAEGLAIDPAPPLDSLRRDAMRNNSSINKAIAERDISERDRDLVMSALYPRISVSAGYNYNRTESDGGFFLYNVQEGFSASVNASLTLFNSFRTMIRSENSEIAIEMNEVAIEQIRARIDMNLRNAYENYEMLKKMHALEETAIETARLNYERTQSLYELGQTTSLELRQSQINLMRARLRLNDVEYRTRLARTELMLIAGRLLDEYK
ncbi:MAG: TolC family protein [Bacteroidota bacterium]